MPELRCTCTRLNDPWRRYCGACGADLQPGCRCCGFPNTMYDQFCGGCGEKLYLSKSTLNPPTQLQRPRPASDTTRTEPAPISTQQIALLCDAVAIETES